MPTFAGVSAVAPQTCTASTKNKTPCPSSAPDGCVTSVCSNMAGEARVSTNNCLGANIDYFTVEYVTPGGVGTCFGKK